MQEETSHYVDMVLSIMIKIQSYEGFDFTKLPYDEIMDQIKSIEGFSIHNLRDSAGGREIYGFSLGDLSKPTLHVHGGIHNRHEWRTVYWIKQYMEILSNPYIHSPGNIKLINYLKSKYSFYFIPCAGPDSYIDETIPNANGVNIPFNFDFKWEQTSEGRLKGPYPFSENESKNIRDIVLDIKPVGFVCCHSWGDFSGFMFRHPHNKSLDLLAQSTFESTRINSQLRDGTDARVDHELLESSAYNWAGQQLSSQGRPIIANVLEAGTIETHTSQSRLGVNGLLMHALYVDKYLTTGTLN